MLLKFIPITVAVIYLRLCEEWDNEVKTKFWNLKDFFVVVNQKDLKWYDIECGI